MLIPIFSRDGGGPLFTLTGRLADLFKVRMSSECSRALRSARKDYGGGLTM